MKTYTITVSGETESDVEISINEAKRLISEGYGSGLNSNDTASFSFESEGEYEEDNADYSDKIKVCSECYSENIRMGMIDDNVGHGTHEGWICDDCKAEDFEPDLED